MQRPVPQKYETLSVKLLFFVIIRELSPHHRKRHTKYNHNDLEFVNPACPYQLLPTNRPAHNRHQATADLHHSALQLRHDWNRYKPTSTATTAQMGGAEGGYTAYSSTLLRHGLTSSSCPWLRHCLDVASWASSCCLRL